MKLITCTLCGAERRVYRYGKYCGEKCKKRAQSKRRYQRWKLEYAAGAEA